MTNSSDKTQRQKKKKGPIRFEAIVPCLIVTGLVIVYFMFFFDYQVRKGIEWAGTYVNGAEVNVGKVSTSFSKGSLEIRDIEVTDKDEPAKNKLQLGRVHMRVNWDALLRAKIVIDSSGITEIDMGTVRKSPGKVLPPESASLQNSYVAKTLGKMKADASRAALEEVGALLEGFDPSQKLKEIGNLKSVARVEELKAQLSKKEQEWSVSLNALPGEKDFEVLQVRLSAIQMNGNPAEIPAKVSQVKSLIQEADGKITTVRSTGETLIQDAQAFQTSISQVDDLIREDRKDLEKRLQIPSLDARSLAEQLFGDAVYGNLGQAEKYMVLARQYMPAKGAGKKVADAPRAPERGKGKTYIFPTKTSYPRFWLKRAEIASKSVVGEILDVTSNPPLLGKPAVMNVKGSFPEKGFQDMSLQIIVDHTGEVPVETLKARMGGFPVLGRTFANSEKFKFGLAKATGSSGIDASLKGDQVLLAMETGFRDLAYEVEAKSKVLESTMQGALADLHRIDTRVQVSGTWKDLKLEIQSNLASALQSGFEKQLQAKISEARRKIDQMIDARISKQKAELNQRSQLLRSKVTAQVDEKRKRAEAFRALAQAKVDSAKAQAVGTKQQAIDQIKKKLPFGR